MTIRRTRIQQVLKKLVNLWQRRGFVGVLQVSRDRLRAKFKTRQSYAAWVAQTAPTAETIQAAQAEMATWTQRPKFSVLMPVYNVAPQWLERAIQSVLAQIYPDWELCIVDDGSARPELRPLLTRYAQQEPRIRVVFRESSGGISTATNQALDLATGDYMALLDHDDELATTALYENAKLIQQHPDADFIYSDEDKIKPSGDRVDPFFKPQWSPEWFHVCMYTCHLGVYRTELVREIGGFRSEFDGAQDYDLVLRLVERTAHIHHIPQVLYHWRVLDSSVTSGAEAKPWALDAAQRALQAMLERSDYPGKVETTPYPGYFRVRRQLRDRSRISLIIPSGGARKATPRGTMVLLENMLQSVCEKSTYDNLEIVLVDGYDVPDQTLENVQFQAAQYGHPLVLVRCREPFNFSHRINQGVAHASGELVLFLNDDVEVLTPDWLESMLAFAQQPEIGAVGAKLFFPTGRLQHVGVWILGGNPGHPFYNADGDHPGYGLSNVLNRNALAVTGACLLVRRSVYDAVGGLDEAFPSNYNDVDFCLKIHQQGYRNVFTPYAQLLHYESASRCGEVAPEEQALFRDRWLTYLTEIQADPYWNPNVFAVDGLL